MFRVFRIAGLPSRSILIDFGLLYGLFQKNGLYLVYILLKSPFFHFIGKNTKGGPLDNFVINIFHNFVMYSIQKNLSIFSKKV